MSVDQAMAIIVPLVRAVRDALPEAERVTLAKRLVQSFALEAQVEMRADEELRQRRARR